MHGNLVHGNTELRGEPFPILATIREALKGGAVHGFVSCFTCRPSIT
jgi:hypothetical protein